MVPNFRLNISENLVVSILQSTQLVQVCHLFSQQLMDLRMVKDSYEEASSKGQHSHVTLLHIMSRCTKYVKDFYIFSETLLELISNVLATRMSFKWTRMTNFSVFINRLYIPQQFRVYIQSF